MEEEATYIGLLEIHTNAQKLLLLLLSPCPAPAPSLLPTASNVDQGRTQVAPGRAYFYKISLPSAGSAVGEMSLDVLLP